MGLKVPFYFRPHRRLYPSQLEDAILRRYGLTQKQQDFLLSPRYRGQIRESVKTIVQPRDKRFSKAPLTEEDHRRDFEVSWGLPSLPKIRIRTKAAHQSASSSPRVSNQHLELRDHAEWGIVIVEIQFCLWEDRRVVEETVNQEMRKMRERFGLRFRRPDRVVCHRPTFLRDLVVLALSDRRNRWSVGDIDEQLKFMGLPLITDRRPDTQGVYRKAAKWTGNADPKKVRRSIVWRMKKLIHSVTISPLLYWDQERRSRYL
jgi:hypothetical protein